MIRQPCSLLPPSESQPRPTGEIPSEARAKSIHALCVCVCACVRVHVRVVAAVYLICCKHVMCAWLLYIAMCLLCVYVECVLIEPEPLNPSPQGPALLEMRRASSSAPQISPL